MANALTDMAQSYLDSFLAPLAGVLARPDVTDILINGPGALWVETLGGELERHAVPQLDEERLWRLARQIASLAHQGISREHPLLSARLPDGSRVQIVAPPATRGPMAIAIRKHLVSNLRLADYQRAGAFETACLSAGTPAAPPIDAPPTDRDTVADYLSAAVRARKTIFVSGGTATGKTTFLNSLIQEIPARERLILIEDTPEIQLDRDNAVGMVAVKGELGEAKATAEDLLQASLRMRPDRIILGELRGFEAYTFLRAVNTGHPGSMTTLHADSPQGAFEQLALIIMQGGGQLRREDILAYVGRVVDIVVQLDRQAGRRVVREIWTRPN